MFGQARLRMLLQVRLDPRRRLDLVQPVVSLSQMCAENNQIGAVKCAENNQIGADYELKTTRYQPVMS